MYEYSRSEYLKALLNQKKTLNANSNSLVNPSMPQADNIAQLASLDTSFSGTSSTPIPENTDVEETDRNWWQRTWDTAQEFVSNLEEGVLSVVDGVVDLGAYAYGAISGDQEGALNFMNYDWEAQALNVLNQIDIGTSIVTGDFFTENYWQEWADTLSAEASRENINQLHANSWTSEMGAEGQQKYNEITQGIGSLLPSIVLAYFTGGASLGVQIAAQGALAGASAFGNSATQALNEGAEYGAAGAYAGIQAGISVATTAATMGIGGAVASKTGSGIVGNVGRSVGEKVFTATGSKTAEVFAAKATEVALRAGTSAAIAATKTATDPLIKQITYDSEALYNAYGDDEKTKQTLARAGSAAANAAITSVVASSVKETGEYLVRGSEGYYANYYSQKAASYQTKIANELKNINKGLESGKFTYEQAQVRIQRLDEYSAKVEQYGKISLDYAEKIYNKAVENQEATIAEQRANATSYAEAHKEVKLDFGVNKDVMQRISAVAQNKSITDSIIKYANQNFTKSETSANGNVRFIANDGSSFEYKNNNTGNLSLMVNNKPYSLTVSVKQGNMVAMPTTTNQTVSSIIALGSSNYAPQVMEVKNNIVPVVQNTTNNQQQPLTITKEVATQIVKHNTELQIKEGLNIIKNSNSNEVYVTEEKGNNVIVVNYVNGEGEKTNLQLVVSKGNEIQSLEVNQGVVKIDESFSLVKPQTTQTTSPTPNGTTLLDPTEPLKPKGHDANLVKAKANWDHQRVLSLKSSNDIVKEVVSTLEHKLIGGGKLLASSANTKIKIVHENKDLGRVLFERANLAKNPKQLDEEINKIVKQIGKTKIVVKDGKNEYEITINDLADKSVLNELKLLVNDLISSRSETSKIAKINARIDTIKEILNKEIENLRHRFKVFKKSDSLMKSIKKKIETNKMPTGYDIRVPELQIFHDLIKGFRLSHTKMGISPASVDNLVENFKIYTEENFQDSFIGFNQEIRDIIDSFNNKFVNGKFPNRALTIEEAEQFLNVLTWVKHSLEELYSERMHQMAEKVKFAGREAEVVNKTFKNKTPKLKATKGISKIKNGSMAVTEVYAQIFGRDSEFYKIAVTDITRATSKRYLVIENNTNQMTKDLKKFDLKETTMLSKKIPFQLTDTNGNKVKFSLTYDQLGDLYAHSLIDENKQVIIDYGIEIRNTKTEKFDSFKLTEDEFNAILAKIPTKVKQYVDYVVIERFSGDYRQYFIEKYEERTGIKLPLEDKYYTMNRGELPDTGLENMSARHKTFIGIHSAVSKKRVNNTRPMRIMGITSKQREYIDDVSQYEMDVAMQNYNALLNKKITTSDGRQTTINTLMEQSVFNWAEYKKQYAMAIMGVRYIQKDGAVSNAVSNFIVTPILANFSSAFKNLLSGFKIYRVVGHKAASLGGIKGIANIFRWKKVENDIVSRSGFLARRWSNHDAIRANTLRQKTSWIHKITGFGMEFIDKFVIMTKAWSAAQLKAYYLYGYEVGSQENKDAAIPILEDIVLRTQSNAEPLYMSKGRAGGFGETVKDLFYVFAADAQQTLQFINDDTVGVKNSRMREQEYRKQAKNQNNDDETREFYRKKAEQEHEYNNTFAAHKRRFSTSLMLLLAGISSAFISQINQWLKGRKDIGELDKEEILNDAAYEVALGWIPIISTLSNAYFNNSDMSTLSTEGWNQLLDSFEKMTKAIESGNNDDIMRAVNSTAILISGFFGIPLKNIKDYFLGAWINIDKESGIKARSFVEGFAPSYMTQMYNQAIEKNQVTRAKGYLESMLYFYKTGDTPEQTVDELVRLTRTGETVVPKNVMSEYTDEQGNKVQLSDEQIKQFTLIYQESTTKVNELLNLTDYKSASDTEKAKMIKKIYDTYYSYAKAKVLKTDGGSKLTNLLLYTNGKVNIGKYVNVLNAISNIKDSKTKTRKELVIEYVNKLRGYTKEEKLLILHLAGYSTNEKNKKFLMKYLSSNGMNKQNINTFLGIE